MKKLGLNKNCLACQKVFYAPMWVLKRKGGKFCSYKCYWETKHDIPWNKGLKGSIIANSGSFQKAESIFTGTQSEYKALHYWVNKNLGKAFWCTFCFSCIKVEWANISHTYKKDLNDYFQLCKKCHFKYDNVEARRTLWA